MVAVQVGHGAVRYDQVIPPVHEHPKCFPAVRSQVYLVAVRRKVIFQ